MRTLSRALAITTLLSFPVLYSSCGDGGGGAGPDPQPAEVLASFELTVPDSIAEGEAFSLTVTAVGNRGTKPLASYNGTVSLSTTLGTVNPSSLTVSSGAGSQQVTLSNPGQQTLTASGGGRTGSVGIEVTDLPEPVIPGDPGATLEQAVQYSAFEPRAEDYSSDHPDLPGLYLSHNTILLAFHVGTTVEQANAVLTSLGAELVGANQGVPGVAPSILFLRLPTTTHAGLEAALATLRADTHVLHAVQDVLLGEEAVPDDSHAAVGWEWEVDPNGGNWGLELIRMPQVWSLNRGVEKSLAATGLNFSTGIVDGGFVDAHKDLDFENLTPGRVDDHGTHVAGIIGAGFGNDKGIDGINPFADLIVMAWFAPAGGATIFDEVASWGESMVNSLMHLALTRPKVMVLNMSLGYTWTSVGIDANNTQEAKDLATLQGSFMILANTIIASARPLPMIVTSAGNDSGGTFGVQDAKWGSPVKYAGLELNAENILVVENVAHAPGSPGAATRRASSNIGGHLSAPGTGILSTITGDAYGLKTGTSQAAPHVAGLVGYLLAVDPTLTLAEIRSALLSTSVPVAGGANNRIDAWGAVMEIDRIQGDKRILEKMADIDDGTLDGNQRVRLDTITFPDFDSLDVDGDGGLGDGKVDMSDFRVWRDWYLRVDGTEWDHFDGREGHPKLDVNDNGVAEDAAGESIFPRGDFNGDGILSLEDTAWVGGAVQDSLSDLDVFKLVFDDPDYDKEELDTLVYSSDITVDASIAFEIYATPPITTGVWKAGTPYRVVTLTREEPRTVFTVKSTAGGWTVWVREGGVTSDRFADSSYGPLARWVGTDAVMWPIRPFEVDVKSTFLNSCDDPGATTAQAISLASLHLEPGDHLYIDGAGTWPLVEELIAVFSESSQIDVLTEPAPGDPSKTLTRRTVKDAINIGGDLLGGDTYPSPPTQNCGGVPTDIPQDFTPFQVSFVRIPDGATHLFLGMGSAYYSDNEPQTDPIRVEISKWYAPEWHDMHQPVSPVGRRE